MSIYDFLCVINFYLFFPFLFICGFISEATTGTSRLDIQIMSRFSDHSCTVWRVSWNLTGTILSSSGDDGCVRMWKSKIKSNRNFSARIFSLFLVFFSLCVNSELLEALEMCSNFETRRFTITPRFIDKCSSYHTEYNIGHHKILQTW